MHVPEIAGMWHHTPTHPRMCAAPYGRMAGGEVGAPPCCLTQLRPCQPLCMHEMLARTGGYAFLIYRYRYIKAEFFYYCINATYCHQLFLSFGGFAPGPPVGGARAPPLSPPPPRYVPLALKG